MAILSEVLSGVGFGVNLNGSDNEQLYASQFLQPLPRFFQQLKERRNFSAHPAIRTSISSSVGMKGSLINYMNMPAKFCKRI